MADFDPPQEDRVLLVEGQDDKHVVLHALLVVSRVVYICPVHFAVTRYLEGRIG